MTTLITLLIGVFIGWNMPQPIWARNFQNKIVEVIQGLARK